MDDQELRCKRRAIIERAKAEMRQLHKGEIGKSDKEPTSCDGLLRRWLAIATLYIWVWICGALMGGAAVYLIAQGMVSGWFLPPPPPQIASILGLPQSIITGNGLKVMVVGVSTTTRPAGLFGASPKGEFLVVTLSMENTTRQPIGALFPDQGYYLTDNAGRTFIPDLGATIMNREAAVLNPGLSLQIALYFDIPPDTRGYTLHVFDAEFPLK